MDYLVVPIWFIAEELGVLGVTEPNKKAELVIACWQWVFNFRLRMVVTSSAGKSHQYTGRVNICEVSERYHVHTASVLMDMVRIRSCTGNDLKEMLATIRIHWSIVHLQWFTFGTPVVGHRRFGDIISSIYSSFISSSHLDSFLLVTTHSAKITLDNLTKALSDSLTTSTRR